MRARFRRRGAADAQQRPICYTDPTRMASRSSTLPRLCGILLLVLAISPATAPFSTCRFADLFDGPAPAGDAILQPAGTTHEPVAAAAAGPGTAPLHHTDFLRQPGSTCSPQHRRILHLQLRI